MSETGIFVESRKWLQPAIALQADSS